MTEETLVLENLTPAQALRLDEIEATLRQPFQSFIDEISKTRRESVDWWVSDLASRNVFTSPLYFDCCRLELAAILVAEGSVRRVRTGNPALARALSEYLLLRGRGTGVEICPSFGQLRWALMRLRSAVGDFGRSCASTFALGRSFYKRRQAARRRPGPKKLLSDRAILVDFYLFESRFQPDGSYADSYFPNLLSFLSNEESERTHFIFTAAGCENHASLYGRLKDSKLRFLVKEDWLMVVDYLFAALYPLRNLAGRFKSLQFRGFDLTQYCNRLRRASGLNFESAEGLLYYRFTRRMKQDRRSLQLVLSWFENQWMDRGLFFGLNRYYPEVFTVGYQGFTFSKVHLSIYPGRSEYRAGVLPKTIGVTGPEYLAERKEFCEECGTVVFPALRFENAQYSAPPAELKPLKVLVALSQMKAVYSFMIRDVLSVADRIPDVRFQFKPHPTNQAEVERFFKDCSGPDNCEIISGDFLQAVSASHVVVGAESGTTMESLMIGRPLILYTGSQAPSKNPVPTGIDRRVWCICYDTEELLRSIDGVMRDYDAIREVAREVAREIRKKYIVPVERGSVRAAMGLTD